MFLGLHHYVCTILSDNILGLDGLMAVWLARTDKHIDRLIGNNDNLSIIVPCFEFFWNTNNRTESPYLDRLNYLDRVNFSVCHFPLFFKALQSEQKSDYHGF